jgi:hypothetical protein
LNLVVVVFALRGVVDDDLGLVMLEELGTLLLDLPLPAREVRRVGPEGGQSVVLLNLRVLENIEKMVSTETDQLLRWFYEQGVCKL